MYQAMYVQYGNQLKLQSDIAKSIAISGKQRNYVILVHANRLKFEHFLSRKKEALEKAGFTIVQNQIPETLWYK